MASSVLWVLLASPWLGLGGLMLGKVAHDWTGIQRATAVVIATVVYLAVLLQALPQYWKPADDTVWLPAAPLLTLCGMSTLMVLAWCAFGTDLHPIVATARGVVPAPPAYSFHVLGMSAVLLASCAVAFGWSPLPLALGSPDGSVARELAHCSVALALWKLDALLMRWLAPTVDWPAGAVSLAVNYRAEHGANPVGAALACLGVVWFEVYVQQLLASPFTLAGWPFLVSALLIGFSAGFVNHSLANGTLNGMECADFYWTVSLLFTLSGSALPVGIYHHLMYSMPLVMKCYDQALQSSPAPRLHALATHTALALANLSVIATLALLLPPVMALRPALDAGLGLVPSGAAAGFGLACFLLFVLNSAGIVAGALARNKPAPDEAGAP